MQHPCVQLQRWEKPRPGEYIVNSHASIDVNVGTTGLGVIIRNANGEIMACFMKTLQAIMDSKIAEALGIEWAIQWRKGVFDLDCQVTVQGIYCEMRLLTYFQRLLMIFAWLVWG